MVLSSAILFTNSGSGLETESDGALQAWELFELPPARADLVVLSACETAGSRVASGEGLVGMVRGFQYLGARNVVASLWNAEDETTADIMLAFYGHLRDGKPVEQALHLAVEPYASREPSTAEGHPYYWAGFQLFGSAAL